MKPFLRVLALGALSVAATSHAAQFDFSGDLAFDNSVAEIAFGVSTTVGNVALWTDSSQNGLNFDPIIQLWALSSPAEGVLLGQNDDYFVAVSPLQSSSDSTLTFAALTAGSYLLTIESYPNSARSASLSDGFVLDGATQGALVGGNSYAAHLSVAGDGVSIPAVPEPSTWALAALGLGVVGWAARRTAR